MGGIVDKFTFVLFLDSSNFTKGTSTAEKAVNGLKTTMLSAYTAIGGIDLFHNMLTTYTDTARSVGRLSEVTGESIKTLQAWQYTMEASGGPVSSINAALMAFNEEMAQVKNYGTSTHMALFARLGINIKPLEKGSKLLLDTAKVLKTLNDTQAFDFGRSLGLDDNTIILLRRYGDGLSSVIRQNEKFAVIKEKDIKLTRQYDQMMAQLKNMWLQMSSVIGPEIIKWLKDKGMKDIEKLFNFFMQHQDDIANGFKNILNTISDLLPGATAILDVINAITQVAQAAGTAAGTLASTGETETPYYGGQKTFNRKVLASSINAPMLPRLAALNPFQGKVNDNGQFSFASPVFTIGEIKIYTQATDGKGVAKELRNLPRNNKIAPQLAGAVAQ